MKSLWMKEHMLCQMEVSFDDLGAEESFGFNDLPFERYRQDLLEEFNKDKAKCQRMPKGVYSGVKDKTHEYKVFDLVYINDDGNLVLLNQKEVLDAIPFHKDRERFVPDAIDKGALERVKQNVKVDEKYRLENFDRITWFLVTVES